jgi:uncharacterized membrane protein (UPF0127 family)
MANWGLIINHSRSEKPLARARWCSSFLCRLRGLTFRRNLGEGEGLLLVETQEGRMNTAIHMFMVFFPITVAWLNEDFEVVDLKVAKPWRMYIPSQASQYILELNSDMIDQVAVGDQLAWVDE